MSGVGDKPFEPNFRSRVEYLDALARWYAAAGRFPDLEEAWRDGLRKWAELDALRLKVMVYGSRVAKEGE